MKKLEVGLCQGRHEMPVTDFVFMNEVNPLDVRGLESKAEASLLRLLGLAADESREQAVHVEIYVSGLTVALVAAMNVCMAYRWLLTLWHYNRETGTYFPQDVGYLPYGEQPGGKRNEAPTK